ncbi:MAG: MFS transporter [Gammaproteobacteria bacterium]|nr:MFS transporter [Gammaproteobacteria bacterium]
MEDSNKMPRGIPFIIANECAERFCYYGINAILSVYMIGFLQFGQARATVWQSMFKFSAYFFPMLGAIVSDVFWGKYRTIITFSMVYVLGCAILALGPTSPFNLALGLGFMAFGTGGIKPCVSTNVGDQFTSRNQHLIERAFNYFYMSINFGSFFSILMCPVWLEKYGPRVAFGIPALMMAVATLVFYLGRHRFAVVPPAGRQWLRDVFSRSGMKLVLSLLVVYAFVAVFWALWDQSNGQTWTLQATSDLMDKNLGFGITLLPAQIQVVNGLFILIMVPIFTFGVYPLWARFTKVTPLRRIGLGLFVTASSFLIVSWIESRIQSGLRVSMWWQILAYVVVTAGEVLVSITALEFSYKQAPLRMKSFIMALFLLSISLGNLGTAAVNKLMVRDLPGAVAASGAQTWVTLPPGVTMITGQKIDFDEHTGLTVHPSDGPAAPLAGTYLVAEVQGGRIRLMDNQHRKSVVTSGEWRGGPESVSTYRLVGPEYFNFFAYLMLACAVVFIGVAMVYREQDHVRPDG